MYTYITSHPEEIKEMEEYWRKWVEGKEYS
jgi:hypothetical protein